MIEKMIREARSQRASDIHISEGQAVYLRIDGIHRSNWCFNIVVLKRNYEIVYRR